jgi:histidyl-tRNA synthetase
MYLDNPKPQKQLSYALDNGIPFMVWIGEDEVKQGAVKLKKMETKEELMVKRTEMVAKLKEWLK